ncbi:1238_t:CDS:2, partial [Cetraspora pellucida]
PYKLKRVTRKTTYNPKRKAMAQQNPVNPPNQPNAIDNLAAQIGALVQQMQAAPAPQINYNAPAHELNLVMYPDFAGGDQDPMTWLDEVEKAFAANLVDDNRKIAIMVPYLKGSAATWWATMQRQLNPVNVWDNAVNPAQSFRPTFITHFRTPTLEGKWFAQLATRKQQPNEDIDAYYTSIQELLRRVESGGHQYPETAKAQIFLNGLRPEFAYESACRQNLSYHPISLSALYSTQPGPYIPTGVQPPTSTSESAIEKLTEAPSSNPQPSNQGNPVVSESNQHTYVSIIDEDAPLFAAGKRDSQRTSSVDRPTKRRKEGAEEIEPKEETLEQLLEEEGNQERNDDHQETVVKPPGPLPKVSVSRSKRVPVVWRKLQEDELPQIASLVPRYSIVSDIQDKPANITYGQLFRLAPSLRADLDKSLKKKKVPAKRKIRNNISIVSEKRSTALYCDAKILEFKKLASEPLRKDHPTTVRDLVEGLEETDDELLDSDEEYEDEELEERMYGYSEIEDSTASSYLPLSSSSDIVVSTSFTNNTNPSCPLLPDTSNPYIIKGCTSRKVLVSLPNVDKLPLLVYHSPSSDSLTGNAYLQDNDVTPDPRGETITLPSGTVGDQTTSPASTISS